MVKKAADEQIKTILEISKEISRHNKLMESAIDWEE